MPKKEKIIEAIEEEVEEEEEEFYEEALLSPKHELFLRLAKTRVEKVLKAFRILGNCANRSSYDYTEEEIDKIFITLMEALENTHLKFTAKKDQKELFEF